MTKDGDDAEDADCLVVVVVADGRRANSTVVICVDGVCG